MTSHTGSGATTTPPGPALQALLERLPDAKLLARFVELDAANEGKDLSFLGWFRRELATAGRAPTQRAARSGRGTGDLAPGFTTTLSILRARVAATRAGRARRAD